MTSSQPKVFISHATKDREFVDREVIPLLKRHAVSVGYIPVDVGAGESFSDKIREGIEGCDGLLVVMSPDASKSRWVKDEVHTAFTLESKQILPVMYKTCRPMDIDLRLGPLDYVDYRSDPDTARRQLLDRLGRVYDGQSPAGIPEPISRRRPRSRRRRRWWWAAPILAVAALLVALAVGRRGGGGDALLIRSPKGGSVVGPVTMVSGIARGLPEHSQVWVVVRSEADGVHYPYPHVLKVSPDGSWSAAAIEVGAADDQGLEFGILGILADSAAARHLASYAARPERAGMYELPDGCEVRAQVAVRRKR
jgi:hypothetical protein